MSHVDEALEVPDHRGMQPPSWSTQTVGVASRDPWTASSWYLSVLWTEEGPTPASSHLRWPLQPPQDLSPGPLISLPRSPAGSSAPWQHDYLWKVTSLPSFTQKGFQGCRDQQPRGFLLKRRWEWEGRGWTNKPRTKIDFVQKSPGCCRRSYLASTSQQWPAFKKRVTNSAGHPGQLALCKQPSSPSDTTGRSLNFPELQLLCTPVTPTPRAAAGMTGTMHLAQHRVPASIL